VLYEEKWLCDNCRLCEYYIPKEPIEIVKTCRLPNGDHTVYKDPKRCPEYVPIFIKEVWKKW